MSTTTATATARHSWDVDDLESVVPTRADAVDAAFAEIADQTRSSGWVCSLTIECGTVVCACQ